MIATDTSTLSAFLKGEAGADVDRVHDALRSGNLCLPPVVLTEMLSDPLASKSVADLLAQVETLEISEGYWQRAGEIRRVLKSRGSKCKIVDALIAQSCIDHNVALIARDADFRHFAKHCGLELA
jgi:predicted nucleic acid-binding protein